MGVGSNPILPVNRFPIQWEHYTECTYQTCYLQLGNACIILCTLYRHVYPDCWHTLLLGLNMCLTSAIVLIANLLWKYICIAEYIVWGYTLHQAIPALQLQVDAVFMCSTAFVWCPEKHSGKIIHYQTFTLLGVLNTVMFFLQSVGVCGAISGHVQGRQCLYVYSSLQMCTDNLSLLFCGIYNIRVC